MMKFDIITIFPDIFNSYFNESIIKRAQEKKLIKINIHNLRDFTVDKHKTVDDRPYGGGAGMILKLEPIFKAVAKIKRKTQNAKRKIILLSAKGKKFNQRMAQKFSKLDRLILICGRYEGVDERVAKYIADEEISIGDYVLTGGELPTMVIIDAATRLVPGVIKKESLQEESFSAAKRLKKRNKLGIGNWELGIFKEYPQYTRPEIFAVPAEVRGAKAGTVEKWRVPKVLLSGNRKKIAEWQKKHSKTIEK